MNREFTEQELIRREKAKKLEQKGIAAFGSKKEVNITAEEIKSMCNDLQKEEIAEKYGNKEVKMIARLMTKRGQGKAGFGHVMDHTGLVQIYIKADDISPEQFEIWNDSDLGDIIYVQGKMMKTNRGEISIHVYSFEHLVKSLRVLPDKHAGLADKEERYRRRYVDLLVNPEVKDVFIKRSKIFTALREVLNNDDFIEVETPILQQYNGGAAARPFKTHHNTLDHDFLLRIATELPLKRLIVGNMNRVYEIGRLFRNEGMDATHNPEFTTIEIYQANADLSDMFNLGEKVIKYINKKIGNPDVIKYDEHEVDLSKPFRRVSMINLIKEETGIDFSKVKTFEEGKKLAKEHDIHLEKHMDSLGWIITLFFEEKCEAKLIQPTFVYDFPLESTPLAKKSEHNPNIVQRFELYIVGKEFANAYTELNDPIDQWDRLMEQEAQKTKGNDEANDIDLDFVEALEYGMVPTGGIGIGLDRLVMLLTNQHSIRDVLLFPLMRPRGK